MRLPQLLVYFDTSPALRLLKSANAPFIIDFLDRQFKHTGRIAISHSELLSALVDYRERTQEAYPDRLPSRADTYLAEWCSPDALWLRRFLEAGRDEPMYQLTPHTEDVFVFLDRVLDRDLGFVGTESRLKLIIDTLTDLVIGSSDDPESRLSHLRQEQQRLQEQVDRIEADGRVVAYQPAQIRERFTTAVQLLRQLQGDFRAVEESFREITLQVQQRQVQGRDSRGGILEFALDAEDVLKREDQGVSFYEFVKLILSPTQTERLEQVIRQLRLIPELLAQEAGMFASNAIMYFIILTTAATLHAKGHTNITTAREAAEALRPLAGDAAYWLFTLGIIGTGILAVPVLAGSCAYAIAEAAAWQGRSLASRPRRARKFYGVMAVAMLIGLLHTSMPFACCSSRRS